SRPDRADVAQVGSRPRSAAVDAMTILTAGLALEQGAAARGVADLHCRAAQIESGTDERDHRANLGGLKFEPGHAGGGHAVQHHLSEIFIRHTPPELPPTQIDPGDAVAVGTVTERALARVQSRAGLDVGAGVLVILKRGLCKR